MSDTIGTPTLWVGFTLFVLMMLALDLGIFHRRAHAVGGGEALGLKMVTADVYKIPTGASLMLPAPPAPKDKDAPR